MNIEDFNLERILREQVKLSNIPNFLMGEARTESQLKQEQDRLEKKMLNELGLAIKRR